MKPAQRLRRLHPAAPPAAPGRSRPGRPWLLPVTVGLVAVLLFDGVAGPVAGVAAAVGTRAVGHATRLANRRRILRLQAMGLPFALDITAACLTAGAPLPQALAAAAAASTGELGTRLHHTGRALKLGEPVEDALGRLAGLPGADRLTAAISRSHRTGAAMAEGLTELADRLRRERLTEATAAAQRAGVWLVLPLCLCFLPAFMLAGLVPLVLSVFDLVLNTS